MAGLDKDKCLAVGLSCHYLLLLQVSPFNNLPGHQMSLHQHHLDHSSQAQWVLECFGAIAVVVLQCGGPKTEANLMVLNY